MRFSYQPNPEGEGFATRPCVFVRFFDDTTAISHLALVDTGSPLTLVNESVVEVLSMGDPYGDTRVDCLAGRGVHAKLYKASMEVVSMSSSEAIPLGDVTIAAIKATLPFIILGTQALDAVVVTIRNAEEIVEVVPADDSQLRLC